MAMARATNRTKRVPGGPTTGGEDRWLAALGGVLWESLPLLLTIDLLLVLALLPALIALVAGVSVLAPLLAVIAGPIWLAATAAGDRLLAGEAVTIRRYLTFVQSRARQGVFLALVPAVALSLLMATVSIAGGHSDQRWLVVPLVLNGCLAMLALLAGSWVFPLAALTPLRRRAIWRLAVVATGSAPVATLGTVALAVLVWVGWRVIGPLLPVVLAAPFALYLAGLGRWWLRWAQRRVDGAGHE